MPQGGSLPVVEELQWEFKMAQGVLAERNVLYRSVTEQERVRNERSALSIFLGELEDIVLMEMMKKSEGLGCRVIALVFDGIFIVGGSGVDFATVSDEIYVAFGVQPELKRDGADAPAEFWAPHDGVAHFWDTFLSCSEESERIVQSVSA